MKKNQLIERVLNKLGGGSVTADVLQKYRRGVVRLVVGDVFDDMMVRVFQNSDMPGKSDLDAYTKHYRVQPIQPADVTGKKFIEIPTITKRLLQIPNNKAIRHIWTIEAVPRKCLYRDLGAEAVNSQLEVSSYLTNPRYEVVGGKIYFNSQINASPEVAGVDMDIIVPFSEWGDEEDLPAPLENNNTIIEEAFRILSQMPPEDRITDDQLQQD
jgi:hypothetical protein